MKHSIIYAEGISGMISKYNDLVNSIAQSGYKNSLVNPSVSQIVLDNPSYVIPENANLDKTKFSLLGWFGSSSLGINNSSGLSLASLLSLEVDKSYLSTFTDFQFKLGVESSLYTISSLKIRPQRKYTLAVVYQIVNSAGTPVEKTPTTGELIVNSFIKEGSFVPMATKLTLDWNESTLTNIDEYRYVVYQTFSSNAYVNNSMENVKILLNSSVDTDEYFIKIQQVAFYEGSAELIGLVDKSHQFLDQIKYIDGVWKIGDVQLGNYVKNIVTVGNNSFSKYKDLTTAFSAEGSNKIFFITSNLTIDSSVSSYLSVPVKSSVVGNNYTLTINNNYGISLGNSFSRIENLTINCRKFQILSTNNIVLNNVVLNMIGSETKGLFISGSNSIRIEDCRISGNESTLFGVYVSNSFNVKIESDIQLDYRSTGVSTGLKIDQSSLSVDAIITMMIVGATMDNYVVFELAGSSIGNDLKLNKLYQNNGGIIEITENVESQENI